MARMELWTRWMGPRGLLFLRGWAEPFPAEGEDRGGD